MDSQIFRDAANLVSEKATPSTLYSFRVDFACEAISAAQGLGFNNNKTEAHNLFHDIFRPENLLPWESAYFGDMAECRQDRAIALDLLAEIIEQGDL